MKTLIHKLIFSIALLIISFTLLADQGRQDSLHAELQKIDEHHADRISVLIDLSWETNRSEPQKSLSYSQEALKLSRELGLPIQEALSLNAQGVVYYYISEYDQALEYFFKVLAIYTDLADVNRMSSTYTNIGNCYEKLMASKEALKYQTMALDLINKTDNLSLKASILNNIGNIHIQSFDYKTALSFLEESLKIKKQLGDSARLPYGYQNIGICHLRLNEYHDGIDYLDSANMLFKKINSLADQSNVLIELAIAYLALRHQQKAKAYLDTAIYMSREVGNLNSEMLAYLQLSEMYEDMGEIQKSFANFKMYSEIKDTLFTADREKRILELNTLYELEKRNNILVALQLKVNKEQQLKTIAIISGSFILLLLLLAVFHIKLRGKHQIQKDQLTQLEKERQSQTIELKNRELMTSHLQQLQKKELLEKINEKIVCLAKGGDYASDKKFKELKSIVKENLYFDTGWEQLKLHFESVHPQFFKDLKKSFPDLTANEKRHCAYIKLNLNTKEIAQLLNISDKSVQMARYRMKKKMTIAPDVELQEVIHSLGLTEVVNN